MLKLTRNTLCCHSCWNVSEIYFFYVLQEGLKSCTRSIKNKGIQATVQTNWHRRVRHPERGWEVWVVRLSLHSPRILDKTLTYDNISKRKKMTPTCYIYRAVMGAELPRGMDQIEDSVWALRQAWPASFRWSGPCRCSMQTKCPYASVKYRRHSGWNLCSTPVHGTFSLSCKHSILNR